MLEGNSALNEVVSQLSSYSKAIGTALNEWEGYPAAAANFESAAGAVGVSVNLPTISLEIPLIVQSIDTVIGSINEFMDNLQSTAEVIGASLSDLGLNSNIKSGYASSKDPSSLTTLIDGSINGDSTIGGFSYVLADGTYITWYGEDEYSDYGDYIKAVQDKAGEDFDLSNLKVLIESKDTPIAWVDLDALNKDNSQDVATPTGVNPTNESSAINTTPNNDEHLGSDESIGGGNATGKTLSGAGVSDDTSGMNYTKYGTGTYTRPDGKQFDLYLQGDGSCLSAAKNISKSAFDDPVIEEGVSKEKAIEILKNGGSLVVFGDLIQHNSSDPFLGNKSQDSNGKGAHAVSVVQLSEDGKSVYVINNNGYTEESGNRGQWVSWDYLSSRPSPSVSIGHTDLGYKEYCTIYGVYEGN